MLKMKTAGLQEEVRDLQSPYSGFARCTSRAGCSTLCSTAAGPLYCAVRLISKRIAWSNAVHVRPEHAAVWPHASAELKRLPAQHSVLNPVEQHDLKLLEIFCLLQAIG